MINSINSIPNMKTCNIQGGLQPASIAAAPAMNPPQAATDLKGTTALAAYNSFGVMNNQTPVIQLSLPTILQPEAVKALKGERIYTSTGDLTAIIDKSDKTTTVYKMDCETPNDAIRKIETFDNATGKLIRAQENLNIINPGQMPVLELIEIKEFYPDSDKLQKNTIYSKGKLQMTALHEYGPNGYEKISGIENNHMFVEESYENINTDRLTTFDKNGKIISVETMDRDNNTKQKVSYKNGMPSKIITENRFPIPNTTGKNPMTDPDLVPAQPYILNYDPKQIQGDRTMYSNGSLESIETHTANNGHVTHRFEINGNLLGIEDAKDPNNIKTVMFYPEHYAVEESSKDLRKTTVFNKDGSKEVSTINLNDKSEKMAMYSKEGHLVSYIDIDKDGKRMLMNFDKQGNLYNIA